MLRSTFQLLSRTEGLFVYSNYKYIFELNGKPTSELCEEFNATYTTPKQAFLGSNLVPVLETQFRFRVGICGVWGGNARTESGFLRKISKFFFSFWETWIFFLQVDLVNPLSNTHTGDTDLRIYDPRKQVGPNLRSGIGWLWKSGVSIPILKIIVSTWGVFKDVKIFRLTCCRSYNSKFVCASNGYERQWNMLKLKSNEYYTRLHSTGVDIPARYKIDSKHKKVPFYLRPIVIRIHHILLVKYSVDPRSVFHDIAIIRIIGRPPFPLFLSGAQREHPARITLTVTE